MSATPRDEPERNWRSTDWTIATYAAHNEALRTAEEKLQNERDRRYAEVKAAEEKALRVKEEADRTALGLQRENQQYRDEKANELRSQIERERGLYVTRAELGGATDKIEATISPVLTYVAGQQGRREGIGQGSTVLYSVLILAVAIVTAFILYSSHRSQPSAPSTVTVTVPK